MCFLSESSEKDKVIEELKKAYQGLIANLENEIKIKNNIISLQDQMLKTQENLINLKGINLYAKS